MPDTTLSSPLFQAFVEEIEEYSKEEQEKINHFENLYHFIRAFQGEEYQPLEQKDKSKKDLLQKIEQAIKARPLTALENFVFNKPSGVRLEVKKRSSDEELIQKAKELNKDVEKFKRNLVEYWSKQAIAGRNVSAMSLDEYYRSRIHSKNYKEVLSDVGDHAEALFQELLDEEAQSPLFRLRTMLASFQHGVPCCNAALSGKSGAGKTFVSSKKEVWDAIKDAKGISSELPFKCSLSIDGGKEREESYVRQAFIRALKDSFGEGAMTQLKDAKDDIPWPLLEGKKFKDPEFNFALDAQTQGGKFAISLPVTSSGANNIKILKEHSDKIGQQCVDLYVNSNQGLKQGFLRSINEGKKVGTPFAQFLSGRMKKKADFSYDNDCKLLLIVPIRTMRSKHKKNIGLVPVIKYQIKEFNKKYIGRPENREINPRDMELRIPRTVWKDTTQQEKLKELIGNSYESLTKARGEFNRVMKDLGDIPQPEIEDLRKKRSDKLKSSHQKSVSPATLSGESDSFVETVGDQDSIRDFNNSNDLAIKSPYSFDSSASINISIKAASPEKDQGSILDLIKKNLQADGESFDKIERVGNTLSFQEDGKTGVITYEKKTPNSFDLNVTGEHIDKSVEAITKTLASTQYKMEATVTLGKEFEGLTSDNFNEKAQLMLPVLKSLVSLKEKNISIRNIQDVNQKLTTVGQLCKNNGEIKTLLTQLDVLKNNDPYPSSPASPRASLSVSPSVSSPTTRSRSNSAP
jgi:hypothetical protein